LEKEQYNTKALSLIASPIDENATIKIAIAKQKSILLIFVLLIFTDV